MVQLVACLVERRRGAVYVVPVGGADAGARCCDPDSGRAVALALVEPAAGKVGGQSLIAASDEVYYRTKAAAVLWMLRSIAGEDALKQALHTYAREGKKDDDAKGFSGCWSRVRLRIWGGSLRTGCIGIGGCRICRLQM